MDEKKKRVYTIRGCHEHRTNFGEMYEKTEQRHELPEIGDKVIVLENTQLGRAINGVAAKYMLSSSYLDAHGKPEVFEVVGFSKSREKAIEKGNNIMLYRPYDKNEGYGHRTEVPSVLVAVGNICLLKVKESIDEVLTELALSNGLPSDFGVQKRYCKEKDSDKHEQKDDSN